MRAHQDVAQMPLLPRHGMDAAQRRERHAADGPLSLSQGICRVPVEASSVPDRGQADRIPVLVRVLPTKRKCSRHPTRHSRVRRSAKPLFSQRLRLADTFEQRTSPERRTTFRLYRERPVFTGLTRCTSYSSRV